MFVTLIARDCEKASVSYSNRFTNNKSSYRSVCLKTASTMLPSVLYAILSWYQISIAGNNSHVKHKLSDMCLFEMRRDQYNFHPERSSGWIFIAVFELRLKMRIVGKKKVGDTRWKEKKRKY